MMKPPILTFVTGLMLSVLSNAQKFFPDDPLQRELPPVDTEMRTTAQ